MVAIVTGKALTQGRTDHFVTYLPFPVKVCFSQFYFYFHSLYNHFPPICLNFNLRTWPN